MRYGNCHKDKNSEEKPNDISADRAKQIKTKAIVNEDPTEKLIRSSSLSPKILILNNETYW